MWTAVINWLLRAVWNSEEKENHCDGDNVVLKRGKPQTDVDFSFLRVWTDLIRGTNDWKSSRAF